MSEETKTYRGNCHCGAFVYEVEGPEIKEAQSCNCSMCRRKGYLWHLAGTSNFKWIKGSADGLTSYEFSQKIFTHKFCPTCGSPLIATGSDTLPPEMKLGINVHCIQGINTWELPKKRVDGKNNMPGEWHIAEHKGSLPAEKEGCKLYKGSCHCGAVTLAVMSPPLDETYEGKVLECNCSICERNGYIWCYPPPEDVVLAGAEENIGRYQFGWKILDKTFCKICGVPMTNKAADLTKEQEEALTGDAAHWRGIVVTTHAVNMRVLEGVDLDKFDTIKADFKDRGNSYVSP